MKLGIIIPTFRLVMLAWGLIMTGNAASRGAESPPQVAALETDAARPEQLLRSDFEGKELDGWLLIMAGGAAGNVSQFYEAGGSATNSHSLRLTVVNSGQRCGIANQGISGLKVKAGRWYDLDFQARTDKRLNDRGYALTVSLESQDGAMVFARTTIPEVGGDFNWYSVALHAHGSGSKARLVITMTETGTIWLDDLSLVAREMDGNQTP